MEALSSADISLFEGFRVDRRGGVLSRRGEQGVFAPIAIGGRALDVLGVLIDRPGDLVSRADIIDAVWPGATVEDSNLNVQIAALRRILDYGRAEGSCIQTVAGRGYRFVAPVTRGEPAAPPRRLTTILAADVASYSRLMGADEEGTYERLKAHLQQLVNPKIEECHGRIVKNTGDGMLAEFANVVDAVRCAAEVQREMLYREPDIPDERRIRFRIGINLGDVIVENDDIFGDGVNIAERLEALAEPGGICISRTVRDQIRDRLPYPLEDRGEQSVKNIARPVRVYALRPETVADLHASGMPPEVPQRRRTALVTMLAVAVAVLFIAFSAWWLWPTTKPSPIPTVVAATPMSQPLVAPRLSVVVLPFANLSNDPDQQYFADAVTEDLTTDLSRIADMLVISRNTAFTYRNKPVDTKQIGRELGVRYALEGSVRRSGSHVRVNAQLIDAEADTHLWAERFDGDTGDLFTLQDEVASRIAIALDFAMVSAEAARPTANSDAQDYIFRARRVQSKPATRDSFADAITLLERALAVDPGSIEAQIRLAGALVNRVLDFGGEAEADIKRAEELATNAVAALPHSYLAHNLKGQVLRVQRRCAEAIPEYETALALYRNSVNALANIGRCRIYVGPIEEAIPTLERAIRLSPRDPDIVWWYFRIGQAHLLQSHIDEAILWLEKALRANAGLPGPHVYLAAAYALRGETERAADSLAEARRLGGEGSWPSLARSRAGTRFEAPAIRALAEATFYAGLRKAGMPEE